MRIRTARSSGGVEETSQTLTTMSAPSPMGQSIAVKWIPLQDTALENPTMSLLMFLERKFIPDHVESKSAAGRTHYHAILKHILRPETVDSLFAPYVGRSKGRLKAADGWPYLDEIRLCDLNAHHLRQLTSSATAHGYSPQTVKHIRNVVGKIISHAQKERIFSGDNPVKTVELPPMQRREPHTLTMPQAKGVLRLMGHPEREMALLTISTGMNLLEISALQWKDVNLTGMPVRSEGSTISPRSVVIRKQWHANGTATAQTARECELKLPKLLVEALFQLKRSRYVDDPNGLVFSTREGIPIRSLDVCNHELKRIGRELDIPWLSWQVLRRAHDTFLSDLRFKLASALALSI